MEAYAKYYADRTNDSPEKNYWKVFNSLDLLYREADSIIKGDEKRSREDIILLLKSYVNDEKIKYFVNKAYEVLQNHNETYIYNKIEEGEPFKAYIKDGYFLTGHFRDVIRELFEKNNVEIGTNIKVNPTNQGKKMKVNLSVPQIALLFRLLNEHDPKIIISLSDLELFDFITNHFTNDLAKDSGMSRNTISNHYYTIDQSAKKYWVDFLRKMISFLSDK